jgi:23S rRNA (pseudouridine1915-N3)-methyltransferase
MRMWLAAVGRSRAGPAHDLYQEYAGRLATPLVLREVEVKKRLAPDELKRQEAVLLLAAVPPDARLVVLDERGEALDSPGFARRMAAWRDGGTGDLAFLVGGAAGHGDEARRRAALLMSLGPMTWPHMMVRAMLAEQIYRAQQINAGHPYHRA